MREAEGAPFGAELVPGGVRFGLWAPAAARVEVVLEPARRALAMEPTGEGWHRLETGEAGPGTLYRYRIDGDALVPDPASRFQPEGVHGPSRVEDPARYRWREDGWRGRPWEEAVLYELHVGTFTAEGTFAAARDRLAHVVELGVSALELMPVATFPGVRGWGYDGVLPFAPHAAYGEPDDLRAFVDAAHGLGLMVLLDVVYNHLGPEGNDLRLYAPGFFTERFGTPWGEAIDFSRPPVREFAIRNALHWLREYRFDGLRLDAVHAIRDDSVPHLLDELSRRVRAGPGAERRVHLVLENAGNEARLLGPPGTPGRYEAQWNDDVHHAMHVAATGERDGYYASFGDDPVRHLGRCLAEGFAWQGEPFPHWDGRARGEPSGGLPPTAFVGFLQNHDQIGNRAFGERLGSLAPAAAVEALLLVLLLAPQPPMLFMGEEWDAREPFLFFCDFHDELAKAVREGRRREFAGFPAFRDEGARERIPDPNARTTFDRSRIRWEALGEEKHARRLGLTRELLRLRHREVVPRLAGGRAPGTPAAGGSGRDDPGEEARSRGGPAGFDRFGEGGLVVRRPLPDGSELCLLANLSGEGARTDRVEDVAGRRLLRGTDGFEEAVARGVLSPWSAGWFL